MPRRPAGERPHPAAARLAITATAELLALMNKEDRKVARAIGAQLPVIAQVVEAVAARLRTGGRLHYFGAGTSGRLAVLDAAECPPTFGVPPDRVVAHLAGGSRALLEAVEGAEDSRDQGAVDAIEARIGPADAVIGISASGETPYVRGALAKASGLGSLTVSITCTPGSTIARLAALPIEVKVGPEVIGGSTRLKAGTAQKLVLNMISTGVFSRLGDVHQGLMVAVRPTNAKLRARAIGIVRTVTGASEVAAARALVDAGDEGKVAIVMLRLGVSRAEAEARLHEHAGDLDQILA
jgi:N-acetylmuramic acid 6-phosphate etherase